MNRVIDPIRSASVFRFDVRSALSSLFLSLFAAVSILRTHTRASHIIPDSVRPSFRTCQIKTRLLIPRDGEQRETHVAVVSYTCDACVRRSVVKCVLLVISRMTSRALAAHTWKIAANTRSVICNKRALPRRFSSPINTGAARCDTRALDFISRGIAYLHSVQS